MLLFFGAIASLPGFFEWLRARDLERYARDPERTAKAAKDKVDWDAIEEGQKIAREWIARRDSVPVREFTIRLAGDEEYRRAYGDAWRADARRRLAAASFVFEHEFRIRLRPADEVEWTSDDEATDLNALANDLSGKLVEESGPDIVVAFSCQSSSKKSGEYSLGGVGFYLGRCCVVTVATTGEQPVEPPILLHELGHVFGCWHSYMPGSVMAPFVTLLRKDPSVRGFDDWSIAAVALLRDRPVHGGWRNIPSDTREVVLRLSRACKAQLLFLDSSGRGWFGEDGGGPPDDE